MKMSRWPLACMVFLFGIAIQAQDKKDAKLDPAKLEGEWKITEGVKLGTKLEAKNIEGLVTITKDTITIKAPDMTHVMSYKLDTKADPIAITMVGKEGPAKDITAEGIIAIEGGAIKLCYSMPNQKRPTKFESKEDTQTLLFTMKSAKAEEKKK